MVLRPAALALAVAFSATRLTAQCADGSALPCANTRGAPGVKLDDRAWIVLPFTNTAHATDLEWLSWASVSLLTFDMRRWTDLRVVPKERVTDLLSAVSESERAQLGLQRALAVARSAGARNLVMGEYLREGTRVTVTANVFDVRTGKLVRPVTQPPFSADSVSAAYRRFSPRLLSLQLPPGTTLNGIGTASTEAVRNYTLGMESFTRSRTDSALTFFSRAVELDSTFALAQLGLGQMLQRRQPPDSIAVRLAFAASTRFAAALPEREQRIIALSQQSVPLAVRCDNGRRLVGLDSADAEGWYAIGLCSENNVRIVDDGVYVRRDASLNEARKAYEHVLALQPHRDALVALWNLMMLWSVEGCSLDVALPACPLESRYEAALVVQGDTLAARFERVRRFDPVQRRREFAAGRLARQTATRDMLARWTAANPRDLLSRIWSASVQTQLGDFVGAKREFDAAVELEQLVNDNNRAVYRVYRADLEWKAGRPEHAAAILDSTIGGTNAFHTGFGRLRVDQTSPDTVLRALANVFYAAYFGVVGPDYLRSASAYAARKPSVAAKQAVVENAATLAFHSLRTRPASDTASEFSLFHFQAFLSRGDTTRARRALVEYDAWGERGAEDYWDAHEMFSAESYLELGDTTTAWTRIEPFARRWPGYKLNGATFWGALTNVIGPVGVTGRAWLLYADLAVATGHRNEAKRGYTMVVAMWEHGDAPVQPLVKRAKDALAALGGL